jgi:hypothetical protein
VIATASVMAAVGSSSTTGCVANDAARATATA